MADKNPEYTMFDWNGKVVYKARGFDGQKRIPRKDWGVVKIGFAGEHRLKDCINRYACFICKNVFVE